MAKVWSIVFGTMALTAALLFTWHYAVITSVDEERKVENAQLRAELARLQKYRDTLKKENIVASTPSPN